MKISFKKGIECRIRGYSNSDWAQNKTDRKSVTGYTFVLANGHTSQHSKKQNVVAQSTAVAEYIALLFVVREPLRVRKLNWIKNCKQNV